MSPTYFIGFLLVIATVVLARRLRDVEDRLDRLSKKHGETLDLLYKTRSRLHDNGVLQRREAYDYELAF